jgi:hypothetical protein
MVFWFVLSAILIGFGAACIIYSKSKDPYATFGTFMIGAVSLMVGIAALAITIVDAVYYEHFKSELEIQRTQYESFVSDSGLTSDNYTYIVDVLEVNKELAELQATKKTFTFACVYPEEIFDLKPIGIK